MNREIRNLHYYRELYTSDIWNNDMYYYVMARGTGKTYNICDVFVTHAINTKNFHGLMVRSTNKKVMETLQIEMVKSIHKFGLDNFVRWRPGIQTFIFRNGATIKLMGAQPSTTIGVPFSGHTVPPDCSFYLIWGEEMSEWPKYWYSSFLQGANRGMDKNGKSAFLFSSNPWDSKNWYIKMINEWLPFNKEKIKKEKWITRKMVDQQGAKIVINHASIYSNYLLPKDVKQGILSSVISQPWMENPVVWGMPGVLGAIIYAHLLERTEWQGGETFYYKDFSIGIDFGEITDSTTAILCVLVNNYKVHVLEEFEIKSNKNYHIDRADLAYQVHKKILEWINKYRIERVRARVDNSASVFIDKLRELAKGTNSLYYEPCSKKLIVKRIDLVTMIMADYRLLFTPNIQILKREMRNSRWKEDPKTQEPIKERMDGNDHTLNAFEYAIEKWWDKLHK